MPAHHRVKLPLTITEMRNRSASIPRHTWPTTDLLGDAYGRYGKLYGPGRSPGQILEVARWVHARRPFFVMADLADPADRFR